MIIASNISLLSGIFLILGYIPYIYGIFRGTEKPSRMSFLIWTISTIILFLGVKEASVNEIFWLPLADTIGCILILFLSIWYGVGGWTKVDKISFGIVLITLIIFFITESIVFAFYANLIVYSAGYISTLKKVLQDPNSESKAAWILFIIGGGLNIFGLYLAKETNPAPWIYSLTIFGAISVLLICFKIGNFVDRRSINSK